MARARQSNQLYKRYGVGVIERRAQIRNRVYLFIDFMNAPGSYQYGVVVQEMGKVIFEKDYITFRGAIRLYKDILKQEVDNYL